MSTGEVVPADRRQETLDRAVARAVARGARVEWQSGTRAVVVFGGRVNHVLHAVLTLLTVGLWLIVWAIAMLIDRERRVSLEVDGSGRLQVEEMARASRRR